MIKRFKISGFVILLVVVLISATACGDFGNREENSHSSYSVSGTISAGEDLNIEPDYNSVKIKVETSEESQIVNVNENGDWDNTKVKGESTITPVYDSEEHIVFFNPPSRIVDSQDFNIDFEMVSEEPATLESFDISAEVKDNKYTHIVFDSITTTKNQNLDLNNLKSDYYGLSETDSIITIDAGEQGELTYSFKELIDSEDLDVNILKDTIEISTTDLFIHLLQNGIFFENFTGDQNITIKLKGSGDDLGDWQMEKTIYFPDIITTEFLKIYFSQSEATMELKEDELGEYHLLIGFWKTPLVQEGGFDIEMSRTGDYTVVNEDGIMVDYGATTVILEINTSELEEEEIPAYIVITEPQFE